MSNKEKPDNRPAIPAELDTEELRRARDDGRCQIAVQTLKDVLFRFEEASEENHSVYDLLSFLAEDLVADGCCAACIQESMALGFEQAGANPLEHVPDDTAVLH